MAGQERATCPYPGDNWTSEPCETKAGAAARLIEHMLAKHPGNLPGDVVNAVTAVTSKFK